ncbi:Protein FAR1-RELATED SEQUENCE 5 [Bienertia sinuspersici]
MERRAEDEKQADADSARFCHQLVSDFPIERVFQKIYTSAKFVEVQQECMKNLYVSIVGCKVVDENVLEYTIEDRVWVRDPNTRKDVPTRRKREYEVKYNSNSYEAWCVCKLMESSGIICRHIIAVFEKNDVEEVHDMFILRRWPRSSETLKMGMSIIVWNARGVCRPSFISNFHRLFTMHNPALILITESRCSHLNFEDVFARIARQELDSKVDESVGLMSGVVLMWNKCMVKVDATTADEGAGPGGKLRLLADIKANTEEAGSSRSN